MTRIIFSRDRAAQLDLLLRSLDHFAYQEHTEVIWHASTPRFEQGYEMIEGGTWCREHGEDFNEVLRTAVKDAASTITFFCDDDIVYRPVPDYRMILDWNPNILCFSLRLGIDNHRPTPRSFPLWNWTIRRPNDPLFVLEITDYRFPGSIDGHTFRKQDVIEMLGSDYIENPTQVETILAHRVSAFKNRRPLMASFIEQKLVGVPVNRVSPDSGVPNGDVFPQATEMLNERFLTGQRIDLDALDFTGIVGCHQEIEFKWRTP